MIPFLLVVIIVLLIFVLIDLWLIKQLLTPLNDPAIRALTEQLKTGTDSLEKSVEANQQKDTNADRK